MHSIFFSKIYSDYHLSAVMHNSQSTVDEIKSLFETINNIIYVCLFSILIVIVILLLIAHKKNQIKIFKKNDVKTKLPHATRCIFVGVILSILFGLDGLGLQTIVVDLIIFIGGILLIIA